MTIPLGVLYILRQLSENGHKAYLVGGCVRDFVLRKLPQDWDIATSARPEDVTGIFEKTVQTGALFGTVTVVRPDCTAEVTTFRTDGEYLDSRRPESVSFSDSIEEDLSRRDFTINAMAMSAEGEMIDPFGGLSDIERKIIRCVGDLETRFSEDALRMLRAFRFAAQLGFEIDCDTREAISRCAKLVQNLSAERIRDEIEKTLMSPNPGMLTEIISAGLMQGRVAGESPSLDKLAALPYEPLLRWGVFTRILYSAGAIDSVPDFLRGLRLPAKTVKAASDAVQIDLTHDRSGIKQALAKHGIDAVRIAAAQFDEALLDLTDEIVVSGECYTIKELAVSGENLIERGVPPGPEIGRILQVLLNHVIENPGDNEREILLKNSNLIT